jgi:hypothetical protein
MKPDLLAIIGVFKVEKGELVNGDLIPEFL